MGFVYIGEANPMGKKMYTIVDRKTIADSRRFQGIGPAKGAASRTGVRDLRTVAATSV